MLLFFATCTYSPRFRWAVHNNFRTDELWLSQRDALGILLVVIQIRSAVNQTLGFMKVTIPKQWDAVRFCSLWGGYLLRVYPSSVACRSLGTSYQTLYSQNSGVQMSSVNAHCELHREVCCVHRKKCRPYVPVSLLRWAGSVPAKIRNINQKILVSVVLAIPQLQTAQITKIQQPSFMKPRCNSGFGFPSCWVWGLSANWPRSLNRVSTSQDKSAAWSRFASWETKVEEVLQGGLEEAWQRGNERLRSRFRFWLLFRSLRSSIPQRCLSIGNSISYIITKDVWYGILCHGLSLCALSDCATLVIDKKLTCVFLGVNGSDWVW